MPDDFKLPLRLLGFRNIPAIPVDIGGMIETLVKLGIRAAEIEQPVQSLTQTLTIDQNTARAHAFLFGGEAWDARASVARERLKEMLGGNPVRILTTLAEHLKDEGQELFADLMDKPSEDEDLTKLSLDAPDQWRMSWTTVPNVAQEGAPHLATWAATVDVAQQEIATREFWPTIADYGLAYNLLIPNKVRGDDLDELKSLFEGFWSPALDAAADAGLLWAIDQRIFESVEPQVVDDFTRFTPGTVTLMVQDATTKAMTPELVRVSGHEGAGAQIFARPGGVAGGKAATDAAWVYALQAAKVSITVYGVWLGHVYHWHIVTAAMQMTMFDELSDDNPIYQLLAPQSNYLIPFDDILLVLWRFVAPPTSISSGWQFLELINTFADGREFFDDDPNTTLARLGITEADFTVNEPWDQYPVAGRLLSIWQATGRYVTRYVDQQFPTDQDVQNNEEIQKWIEQSGKKRGGNVRGLPKMDSRQALASVVHSLVYRITAHGTSRLIRAANPALTFVANFPPCLQDANIPEPSADFDTKTLLQFLPKTGTIAGMVTFYFTFSFSVPYEPFVPIEGITTNLYLDDESNPELIKLRKFVVDFVEKYQPETPQIYQWPLNIET
ncbi:MAG: lipoxygenase family protein [Acidobacteriota bacterium]